MRGISFEIPNAYGKYLFEILDNINITDFICRIGRGEAYTIEANQLNTSLFPTGDVMDGTTLYSIISKEDYYLIFADVREIETYQEFLKSECPFELLVVDSSSVYIYSKDQGTIKQLHSNVVAAKYENINFLTDENDTLTTLITF